jgi:hypothetical protein
VPLQSGLGATALQGWALQDYILPHSKGWCYLYKAMQFWYSYTLQQQFL